MKLATRAKLKSVSKQFVDNLATRTHTHRNTHSLTVTRTAKTLFFAAHWRHLLPAYANSALNAYTHSLILLCLAGSHSCTLSHSVSHSLLCSLPLCASFVVLCSFAGNNRRDLAPSSNLVSFHSFALCSASRSIRSKWVCRCRCRCCFQLCLAGCLDSVYVSVAACLSPRAVRFRGIRCGSRTLTPTLTRSRSRFLTSLSHSLSLSLTVWSNNTRSIAYVCTSEALRECVNVFVSVVRVL